MKNIGTGNIEGLPSSIKTVYVQHDESAPDTEEGQGVLDELMAGEDMRSAGVLRDDALRALLDIRFSEEMLAAPRSALSGGWKMKLVCVCVWKISFIIGCTVLSNC